METRKCFIRRNALVSTSPTSLLGWNCWVEEDDCYSLNVTWKWSFWEPLYHLHRAVMIGISVHLKGFQGIPMFPDDSLWGGRQTLIFGTGLGRPSLREFFFVYNLPDLWYYLLVTSVDLDMIEGTSVSTGFSVFSVTSCKGGIWWTKANNGAHIFISTWTPVVKRHGWWRDHWTHYIQK